METQNEKLKRKVKALEQRVEWLTHRLDSQSQKEELLCQVELLNLIASLITRIDARLIAPGCIRYLRGEQETARQAIRSIIHMARQGLATASEISQS